ncbi:MAG: hypothetical protein V1844_11520 [Pseudomonadota bacterium]
MERCPVCNARYTGNRQCHRCKADIWMLADIEETADAYRKQAVAAYQTADYPLMLDHARRSCSLRKTPEAVWLMACAAFLTRRYEMAMRLRNST